MAIDIKTKKKIAKLSRLKLADAQIDVIAKELSEVLVFVEQLDQVDTSSFHQWIVFTQLITSLEKM